MSDVQDIYKLKHFGASFMKLHQGKTKLLEFLAFVIVNMGAPILNI